MDIVDTVVLHKDETIAGLKDHAAWIAITASPIAARAVLRLMDIVDTVVLHKDETIAGLKDHAVLIIGMDLLVTGDIVPRSMAIKGQAARNGGLLAARSADHRE